MMKNLLKYSMMFLVVVMCAISMTSCNGDDPGNGNQDSKKHTDKVGNSYHGNDGGQHECVDLGLSVKWATCNVGATQPEEFGYYFAWGETVGYNTDETLFSWTTYKWCKGSYDSLTKYCENKSYGSVDNKTVLDKEDDAASVNWGGAWRMPTKAEFDELRDQDNCTWTWKAINGVNGYVVTSNKNGNSIFLPAAGYRYDNSINLAGSASYYWSSFLDEGGTSYAYCLYLSASIKNSEKGSRVSGRSIRAVCP